MDPKRKSLVLITIVLVLAVALACQLVGGNEGEAPVEEIATTEPSAPTETVDTQATAGAQATQEAQSTADAQATADAQGTATAEFEKTQAVLDKQATLTQAFALKQTSTAETKEKATAQAQVMLDKVQQLFTLGKISTTEGDYYRIEDFDESWAQLGWWKYFRTGYEATNFAIATDASWSSDSDNANWPESGCGFVFGELDNDNQSIVWIAMDGMAYMGHIRKGNGQVLIARRYGDAQKDKGQAKFLLSVFDKKVTLYINNQEVIDVYDRTLVPGNVDLTLRSGTNKGYGTRCQMNNIDLWIFK